MKLEKEGAAYSERTCGLLNFFRLLLNNCGASVLHGVE